MKDKLTEQQSLMVEEMIPYISYVLSRLVPYVPPYLQEDSYSVACEALCNSAVLYDGVRASFKTYAIQSMRKSVLKFLMKESAYSEHSIEDTDEAAERVEDSYYGESTLDRLIDREALVELYQSSIIDDEIRDAFFMLSNGSTIPEIAQRLHVPESNLRNRITKARGRIIKSGKWSFASRNKVKPKQIKMAAANISV